MRYYSILSMMIVFDDVALTSEARSFGENNERRKPWTQ